MLILSGAGKQMFLFMCDDLVKVEGNPNYSLEISVRNLEFLAEIRESALQNLREKGFPCNYGLEGIDADYYEVVKEVITKLPETLHTAASRGASYAGILLLLSFAVTPYWRRTSWWGRGEYYVDRESLVFMSHQVLWDYLEAQLLQPFLQEIYPGFEIYELRVQLPGVL